LVNGLLLVALGAVGLATVFFIVNALILLLFHIYSWHNDVLMSAATDALYIAGAAVAGLATIVVAKVVQFVVVYFIWTPCIWVEIEIKGEPEVTRRRK
jgi:hypothetical protein